MTVFSPTWHLNSEKTPVYENDYLRVLKQECIHLRTGQKGDFFTLDVPDCVVVIALNALQEIALVRQYRHGSETFEYELPGGCLDGTEGPLEAARRELREEVGAETTDAGEVLCSFYTNPVLCTSRCTVVLFRTIDRLVAPQWDNFETLEILWIKRRELVQLYLEHHITHALIHAALGYFFLKYPEYQQ